MNKMIQQQSVLVTEKQHSPAHMVATCPHCNSTNVFGMSRVVGYYSRINNWNSSKKQEFFKRQDGDYKVPQ